MKQIKKSLIDLLNSKGDIIPNIKSEVNYVEVVKDLSNDEKTLLAFYRAFYPQHPTYITTCESKLKNAAILLARKGLVVEIPFSAHMHLTQKGLVVSYLSGH